MSLRGRRSPTTFRGLIGIVPMDNALAPSPDGKHQPEVTSEGETPYEVVIEKEVEAEDIMHMEEKPSAKTMGDAHRSEGCWPFSPPPLSLLPSRSTRSSASSSIIPPFLTRGFHGESLLKRSERGQSRHSKLHPRIEGTLSALSSFSSSRRK